MTDFPNKIIISRDIDTKEFHDYWVLNDFTDNIKKEYVRLDNACEWLRQNLKHYLANEKNIECLVDDFCKGVK